jgi:hypothetical protein
MLTSEVAVLNAGRLIAAGETNAVLGSDDVLSLFRPAAGAAA